MEKVNALAFIDIPEIFDAFYDFIQQWVLD